MEMHKTAAIAVDRLEIHSELLERVVLADLYLPDEIKSQQEISLLLINDGQDLEQMHFDTMLSELHQDGVARNLVCVGIHCGEDRINEYGMIHAADHMGRGAKAALYDKFIFSELIPAIHERYPQLLITEKIFAGFSLGALSAFDITWNHPGEFSAVGVFSGSLWWRSRDKFDKEYNQFTDRLMHMQVRKGDFQPGMRFFFQCGEQDEMEDRNRNGVIDSIDDTLDLMRELLFKGYREGRDMYYLQLPDGRHDVASWGRAMPVFLKWLTSNRV